MAAGGAREAAEGHTGNGAARPDLEELKSAASPADAGQGSAGTVWAPTPSAPSTRPAARRASGQAVPGGRSAVAAATPLDQLAAEFMADAPFCDVCGHITVRSGACYKCLNCGNSMGCS